MKLLYPTHIPYITQHFGAKSPAYITYHHGTDFRVWNDPKKEILSSLDGTVVFVDSKSIGNYYQGDKSGSVYGVHCIIKSVIDSISYFVLYGHLENVFVNVDQKVKSGEVIGIGGNTGKSQGAHLHFELRKDKNIYTSAINAEQYFVSPETPPEWAKEAWNWATLEGITDGTNPNDPITRAEVITMLHRALTR
uniref:Putative peptidase n=1 Tax=viral metagenome TaxID=1070528 RepID=A0A6H2A098_9ZZZZ